MKVLLYASCLISLFLTLFSLTEEKNIEIIIHLDNDITEEEQRIWKQQQIYCSQQHISQTPSMIIDGYYVPEFYQLKELKYVLT